ncbi:MAG: PhnD/SsuA/transferrin family substrate-binding protein [Actinobacteria bacterium]|nr:PhnD/SsuA/transferrin family substrate-binding protein [Actinomycetota bacterium]
MSPYVAGLPMYDWPEVRDEVDALWTAIAARLRAAGIEAPLSLTRPDRFEDLWTVPELLLGQACGLNLVDGLRGRVEVLGSLDHGVEGCDPGDYRSVLVCRVGDTADDLAAFRGRCAAFNGRSSWSGHGALMSAVAPLADDGRFFGECVETGTHRESIRRVAAGEADVAAIDAVAWHLALDHEPAVDEVRILGWTDPTPAPPLVVGWAHAHLVDAINAAVVEAVASLSPEVRRPLDLYGYRVRPAADYEVIAERLAAAAAAGYPTVA